MWYLYGGLIYYFLACVMLSVYNYNNLENINRTDYDLPWDKHELFGAYAIAALSILIWPICTIAAGGYLAAKTIVKHSHKKT